jgi:maleate isomerase
MCPFVRDTPGINALQQSAAAVYRRCPTRYGAKRIGLITPLDRTGNASATPIFEDIGFEVVSSVGFSCVDALHIAHVPDWGKEKTIMELLATDANRLDAMVQCGTNMSMIHVAARLEPVIGIPVLGINATAFWCALRENGFGTPVRGAGGLLRDF